MRRSASRGMTLLEILVSLAILAMISLLIYGAFDALNRGKKGEAMKAERSRQGRGAVDRMAREIQTAYLSLHTPTVPVLQTRLTAFIGQNSTNSRVDFTAFAHRRTLSGAPESDQAEIGYFVVKDPDVDDKFDLARREQTPIDMEPWRGGVINVLAEDVESFQIRYLDPLSGQWLETWDTRQMTGQLNRLPFEVLITLTLAHVPPGVEKVYTTKVQIPIQKPLAFGIPQ